MIHTFTRLLTIVILWLLAARAGYAADKFTIVVVPDTQNYVDDDKEIRHFKKQMQWIVDNRVDRNIVFVTHVGDIVQNGGVDVEWQRTIAAMSILEKGAPGLPYGIVLGNHDTHPTYNANGSAANYVKHFGSARFAGKPWYGGADDEQRNHYQLFSAGGRRFLNLSLEWRACSKDNSDFADVTAWAQSVLDDHPKSPTIITTHEYTEPGGRRNRYGDEIFKALVAKNSQVFMVICGHRPGEGHQTVKNAADQDVFELLADHQNRPEGGQGWLQMVELDEDNGRINVTTYSPSLDKFETDADSQFSFPVDFDARLGAAKEVASGIDVSTGKDSTPKKGFRAKVTNPNLARGATASSPDDLDSDGDSTGDPAAIDGDSSTFWDEIDGKQLYRLRLDLDGPKEVAFIHIEGYAHHRFAPKDFDILCDDKVIKQVRGAVYDFNIFTTSIPATKCNSLELGITGYYGGSPAIRELELYGPGTVTTEGEHVKHEATVTVDTDAESKIYNRWIFGGFLEHFNKQVYGGIFEPGSPLADKQGFRTDVIEALKELKVSNIRWPGGLFVDGYRWRDGVGPRRNTGVNHFWGGPEPHTFGTGEFVELCRRLNCEPYICHNGTVDFEEMKDWLEYCNSVEGELADLRKSHGHPEPYNVKIWSVGNERHSDAFARKVADVTKRMKEVDPSILMTCPGCHDSTGPIKQYLLEMTGKHLDYISVHWYWVPRRHQYYTVDYLNCIMKCGEADFPITRSCDDLDKAGLRGKVKIAFDEWNLRGWHHPKVPGGRPFKNNDPRVQKVIAEYDKNLINSQYTMADALFTATFFNACLRHPDDVVMANIAPIVNTRGPLFVHPKGIVKRTHFHAMAMYASQLQPRVGQVAIEAGLLAHGKTSIPLVDAVATVDASGKKWAIALQNRHPSKSVACTVKMKDLVLDGEFQATVLTSDSPEAYNDTENPNRVAPKKTQLAFTNNVVNLPPHSLMIVEMSMK